ncbi:luciferin 4-monooxygenase-like [Maniola jurtina]|uniref:luciferin 4-monooxygenase-like n=1 Tax=Maniola jurtina TaxID=191418 RepID=UPI001E688FAF|nr:luciferin 4-monooxygenase-like [Maniola jurtina]XP_045782489.1 luciferin 4-monooxygenase-like [Maniola jurtina]
MLKNPKYVYGPVDRYVTASLNFGEFILNKIHEHRDTVALINGSTHEQLTYGEIAQEAMNIAVSLRRMGIRKGDVIAVSSENRREFWSSVIGIICSGAIATTINIGYTNDELKHVMGIAKPKYIILSPLAYKTHAKNYRSLPYLKKIILFGDDRPTNTILYNDIAIPNSGGNNNKDGYRLTENIKYEEFQAADVDGDNDTLFILYSSGTTGLPKGVVISHLNVITLCSPNTPLPSLKGLSITPWYHTMGLIGTLSTFTRGVTGVYLPKFDVDLYLKTVEKYQISQLTVVPAALIALCKSNLKYDTSTVLIVYCGAAPLYEETAKAVRERFPSVQALLQGYGMTETTLAITLNFNPEKIGSVGTVISHTIVKVVNPETREVLGPNQEGEICVKSVMLMKGYIGKDRKEDFDEEGFLRTGDIGYYDDDQFFYIVDRLKELIKYKAYQVPPAEIETTLLKHPSIREAGVVGIPHPTAGEVPLAFVALQPGVTLTEKEIQDFVAERLSNPKHLRGGVRFIDEIPRNQTGKILRRELRKIVKTRKSKL